MQILITNDDGIFAVGLKELLQEVSKLGNVVVVVPDQERSSVSHSLTLREPIRVRQVDKNIYILKGTPADCVRYSVLKLCKYKKIDVVISGINCGPNLGQDVIYSGTVAGAREAAMLNISSFAISLYGKSGKYYSTAAKVALRITQWMYKERMKLFLNINVPDLPLTKIRGFKVTKLGNRVYEECVKECIDPFGLPYYWLKGRVLKSKNSPGSDIVAVKEKMVSITPLTCDMTDYSLLDGLVKTIAENLPRMIEYGI